MSENVAKNMNGFSLVELTVTLAITAIIAVLAIPAATESMLRAGVENTTGQIIALAGFARTEALRRGADVVICGAQLDGSMNLTGCNSSANWSNGIVVFQDLNLNNGYNSDEKIKFIRFDAKANVTSSQTMMTVSSGDVDKVSSLTICVGKAFTGIGKYFSQQIQFNSYTASVACTKTDNATCGGC